MEPTREQILSSRAWAEMVAELEASIQRKFLATPPSDIQAIQDLAYQHHALRGIVRALKEGPEPARVNRRSEKT